MALVASRAIRDCRFLTEISHVILTEINHKQYKPKMKVSFENPDKINGLLTITVEEDDYKNDVEKELKEYRKRANIPGFRPGKAPMGMIKRQFEPSAKMDAINKVLNDELQKYIADNKIQMLGEPLASDKQEPQDLEKPAPYTFMFDIAVAPEFNIELSDKDTVDYYEITVDDALVDKQVDMFANRLGGYVDVEDYQENDMLKGDIRRTRRQGQYQGRWPDHRGSRADA